MPLRSGKLASLPDSPNPRTISPSDINIFAKPETPQNGDVWIEAEAGPPVRITMYVQFGGVTYEFVPAVYDAP